MKRLARELLRRGKVGQVLCAYLEIAEPSILRAIDECVAKGAEEMRLVPYFVLSGRHVKSHIPDLVRQARQKHRGVCRVLLAPYLGYHEHMRTIVEERLAQAR